MKEPQPAGQPQPQVQATPQVPLHLGVVHEAAQIPAGTAPLALARVALAVLWRAPAGEARPGEDVIRVREVRSLRLRGDQAAAARQAEALLELTLADPTFDRVHGSPLSAGPGMAGLWVEQRELPGRPLTTAQDLPRLWARGEAMSPEQLHRSVTAAYGESYLREVDPEALAGLLEGRQLVMPVPGGGRGVMGLQLLARVGAPPFAAIAVSTARGDRRVGVLDEAAMREAWALIRPPRPREPLLDFLEDIEDGALQEALQTLAGDGT